MNLTGTKKAIGGFALAGAMLLTGVVGFAQQQTTPQGQDNKGRGERQWGRGEGGKHRRGGMRGGFGGRFMESLNLTDAQKEQMKQIATRYHENFKAQREQMRGQRHEGGFDAFKDGTFNESAVRAAAQARANARVEREVAKARMMSEMYNVLTPEQKAQLASQRQQREQKRQEWRSRRNAAPATDDQDEQ